MSLNHHDISAKQLRRGVAPSELLSRVGVVGLVLSLVELNC
jgi:hypothetical protein